MTDAQTEARAIVSAILVDERLAVGYQIETLADAIVEHIATALAAKDAELERRDMQLEASAKVALDLSAQLAEANKALDQIAAIEPQSNCDAGSMARSRMRDIARLYIARRDRAERAGGVKVGALEWKERVGVDGTFDAYTSIGHYIATITDDDRGMWFVVGLTQSNYCAPDIDIVKAAAQADYERRILSALTTEPAAPEGRQDDDRIRREMDEILRKQSERDIPFAPSTRPAEQAVTEAIQEIIRQLELTGPTRSKHCDRQTLADELRAALRAAMEAGRHD